MVRAFEDRLAIDRSPTMVRKARVSLGALLPTPRSAGWSDRTWSGVARPQRRGKDARAARQNGKLKVGVDIPSPDEIRAIIAAASDGRRRLAAHRDLHRPARLRAARPALG